MCEEHFSRRTLFAKNMFANNTFYEEHFLRRARFSKKTFFEEPLFSKNSFSARAPVRPIVRPPARPPVRPSARPTSRPSNIFKNSKKENAFKLFSVHVETNVMQESLDNHIVATRMRPGMLFKLNAVTAQALSSDWASISRVKNHMAQKYCFWLCHSFSIG